MFCYQCEQSAIPGGCDKVGVCGKTPTTSNLQDLLVYVLEGLSKVALQARELSINEQEVNEFIVKGLFNTVTNVNFDPERIEKLIHKSVQLRENLKQKISAKDSSIQFDEDLTRFTPETDKNKLNAQAHLHAAIDNDETDADIQSLKNTMLYGLKGLAAYADHAQILGQTDDAVYEFIQRALVAYSSYEKNLNDWVGLTLECGKVNFRVMELLDAANTGTYGHPAPTEVPLGAKKGKAILVSGHDLKDMALLLEQTKGKGINIYTHSEMLPCHAYPELHKYEHFYGHYGTAWQNQLKEFAAFPGAILMTTNCIQNPVQYIENIFTTGEVAWPGVAHIADKDFTPVIEKALEMPGFTEDTDKGSVMAGFGHHTVLSIADKVIDAVKSGKIRHFFVVGGCDGAKPGRNYYTELVEQIPKDCIVLTLACGKFRFFDKKLGDIDGIPRLLDLGQCNDAYSAIKIALALSEAFGVGVNELPLSLILSWYEQKAVAILLTLLSLGIKNIRLGPTLPKFITPNVLNVLVENYNIAPITTPEQDLKDILG